MTDEFRSELRKAFHEIGLDLTGAAPGDGWRSIAVSAGLLLGGGVAGSFLSHLVLGEHWVVYWVAPVVGAWLLHAGVHHVAGRFGKQV
jgi:hypothetical protein